MTRPPLRAVVIGAVCLTLLLISGRANAEPRLVCDDKSDPSSCVMVADSPGTSEGEPAEADPAPGGYKFNDGNGKANSSQDDSASPTVGGTTSSRPVNSTECDWIPMIPGPPAADPRWGGADPATNTMIYSNCNGPTRFAVAANGAAIGGAVVAPPPPDPAQLAQEAIGQLRVPQPHINLGPNPNEIAVNFYTWLWVDYSPPITKTVTAGPVSVTATATFSSVVWSMGEPLSLDGGGVGSVTCEGMGVAPSSNANFNEPPPCGYMFKYRSLQERTNGVGQWPVSATATWSVTWAASTGQTGADSLSANSTTNVEVGEYRTTRGTGG